MQRGGRRPPGKGASETARLLRRHGLQGLQRIPRTKLGAQRGARQRRAGRAAAVDAVRWRSCRGILQLGGAPDPVQFLREGVPQRRTCLLLQVSREVVGTD